MMPQDLENILQNLNEKSPNYLVSKLVNLSMIVASIFIHDVCYYLFYPIGFMLSSIGFSKDTISIMTVIFGCIAAGFLAAGAYFRMRSDARANNLKKMELEEMKRNMQLSKYAITKEAYEEELAILREHFKEMNLSYDQKISELHKLRTKYQDMNKDVNPINED